MLRRAVLCASHAVIATVVAAVIAALRDAVRDGWFAAHLAHLPLYAAGARAGALAGRAAACAVVVALVLVGARRWRAPVRLVLALAASAPLIALPDAPLSERLLVGVIVLAAAACDLEARHAVAWVATAAVCALVPGAAWAAHAVQREPGLRPNLVLVVLDTVAAGHLAPYGGPRVTTPELDALAARGTMFTQTYAVAPWTLPTHATMFTGRYPIRHGAGQEHSALDRRLPTLAELLRDAGYRALGVSGNPIVGPHTGLDRGFRNFVQSWRGAPRAAGALHPNVVALEQFLDQKAPREPFFAFLNFNDAHAPRPPRGACAERFLPPGSTGRAASLDQCWQRWYAGRNPLTPADLALLGDLYDGALSCLAHDVADTIAALERRGLAESTIVLITADHGENIGEHGHLDHVFDLSDTLLHVPLLALGPGFEAGRIDAREASTADIFATLAAAAGLGARAAASSGHDLRAAAVAPPGVAEYGYPSQALAAFEPELLAAAGDRLAPYRRRIRALRSDGWKLIWGSDGRHALYHLADDPHERADRAASEPQRVHAMTDELEQRLAALAGRHFTFAGEPPPRDRSAFPAADAETLERLRSLGYAR